MKNILTAIAIGIGVLWACLLVATAIQAAMPQPLHNVYYPFSVETQIRDR